MDQYHAVMAAERLQKVLARGGIASRRAAEELIAEGRVRVNGKVVKEMGTKVDPRDDRVEVDGQRVVAEHPVYYALHKPRGFVTTLRDPEGRPAINDLLKPHGLTARVFPVGRLDYNTSGLLLLTNDGEFSDGLLHPKRTVPKTYIVKVQGQMEPKHLDVWRAGVQLEDGKTRPAEALFIRHEGDKTWFQITITEGRNQQIRRMGDATGFRVMRLARQAFAGITLENLRPGDLRSLTFEELVTMKKEYGVPRRPAVVNIDKAQPMNVRYSSHAAQKDERENRTAGPRARRAPIDKSVTPRSEARPVLDERRTGRADDARAQRAPRARPQDEVKGGGRRQARSGAPTRNAPRDDARGGAPSRSAPRDDARGGAPTRSGPRDDAGGPARKAPRDDARGGPSRKGPPGRSRR